MANDTGTAEAVKGAYKHPEFPHLTLEQLKESASKFNLDDHLVGLLFNEPFYGSVLLHLHKVATESISTAGVLFKDDVMRLWWNPLFVAPYSNSNIRGLLKHECLHLCLEHTTVRRYEPHTIWNWATDLAINCAIPDNEFIKCGLRPGTPLMKPADFDKRDSTYKDRYNKLSSLIMGLKKDLTAEEYFTLLMNDPTVREMAEEFENEFMFDNHDGWDELSDDEREVVAGKIRAAVKEAQAKADSKNSWGSVPAHMREEIRKKVNGEIDWRSVLRSFIGNIYRADRIGSVYRLNKKYPGIHPGTSRDTRPKIAIFLDQSGSVSDEEISLLFGELASLSHRTDFKLFYFDTEVDEENAFIWKKGSFPKTLRTRCGGTDFEAPTRFIKNSKEKFEGYLILTDGGAPKPSSSRIKRGWVLTPGTSLAFGDANADSNDIVIKMKKKIGV